ncbi:hypothetical protein SOASR032_14160 [Pragia fontium]|uniref:Uncharacterized protein n=1 Tax=Pragia fontium TaxID=82985 RepID=A0ABQ5LIQ7_9GAMM|nr:hypothetical protein SOASR032_14160 [Pragia fontium]
MLGLLSFRSAFANYNVIAKTAIAKVTISGVAETDTGLIFQHVIKRDTVSGTMDCGPGNLPAGDAYHYM